MDYDKLYNAAREHAEHPIKNKCQIISDTVEMVERYLSEAFIEGSEWAIKNQNARPACDKEGE